MIFSNETPTPLPPPGANRTNCAKAPSEISAEKIQLSLTEIVKNLHLSGNSQEYLTPLLRLIGKNQMDYRISRTLYLF